MREKKAIIWDWNGTLLNDAHVCIDCMNVLLQERGLEALTESRYKEIFTFPVKEYYERAGFDFSNEDFDIPAHQFIDLYRVNLKTARLHKNVREILEHYRNEGIMQVILSAMEQDFLLESINNNGITGYFDHINGINNHLAHSKSEIATRLIKAMGVPAENIVLIGDTIHDHEVARHIHTDCILIAHGHQSVKRLQKTDCLVLHKISDLLKIV